VPSRNDSMALGGRGQLPGGQTAKARPGYRVQSLQNGHTATRPIKSKHDPSHARRECLSRCGQPKICVLVAFTGTPRVFCGKFPPGAPDVDFTSGSFFRGRPTPEAARSSLGGPSLRVLQGWGGSSLASSRGEEGPGVVNLHPQGQAAERFAYRHSSTNAMPAPMRTNDQTQTVLT